MVPLPQIGLALAGSSLLSRQGREKIRNTIKSAPTIASFNPPSPKASTRMSLPGGVNPLQGLFGKMRQTKINNPLEPIMRGLNSTLAQITKPAPKEDYYAVIRDFMPTGAKPLKPKYPSASRDIDFADLDGDSQNELIASFAVNNEIRTIVLKKQEESWKKIYEVMTPTCQGLHYRGTANIAGDGRKKQLLIATPSKDTTPVLHGYSLDGGTVHKLFEHKSHRFEVVPSSAHNSRLAFWHQNEEGAYDVELMQLKDSKLQPSDNIGPYYYRHVLPQHVQRIRQSPTNPADWYNLAYDLKKTGLKEDARAAINMGMRYDRNEEYKDRFLKLKEE